jgi:hypothetical protein
LRSQALKSHQEIEIFACLTRSTKSWVQTSVLPKKKKWEREKKNFKICHHKNDLARHHGSRLQSQNLEGWGRKLGSLRPAWAT